MDGVAVGCWVLVEQGRSGHRTSKFGYLIIVLITVSLRPCLYIQRFCDIFAVLLSIPVCICSSF
jgi:hypothetical protein